MVNQYDFTEFMPQHTFSFESRVLREHIKCKRMIPAEHETKTLYYTSVLPLLGVDDLDSFIYVLDGHDR